MGSNAVDCGAYRRLHIAMIGQRLQRLHRAVRSNFHTEADGAGRRKEIALRCVRGLQREVDLGSGGLRETGLNLRCSNASRCRRQAGEE